MWVGLCFLQGLAAHLLASGRKGHTYVGKISGEQQVWLLIFPRACFCFWVQTLPRPERRVRSPCRLLNLCAWGPSSQPAQVIKFVHWASEPGRGVTATAPLTVVPAAGGGGALHAAFRCSRGSIATLLPPPSPLLQKDVQQSAWYLRSKRKRKNSVGWAEGEGKKSGSLRDKVDGVPGEWGAPEGLS